MTPSVGRIVHYQTRGSADGAYPPTCFAAIVTAVCPEDLGPDEGEPGPCVDLVTFGPDGLRFEHHVGYGEDQRAGTWHWPERVA